MRGRIAKRLGARSAPDRLSASSPATLVNAAARLRVACAVWIGLWTLGLVLNNIVGPLISPGQPLDDAWPIPANPIAFGVIAVSLALFIYLGRAREPGGSIDDPFAETLLRTRAAEASGAAIPPRRLLDLALGYEVFLAAAIGVVNQWTPNVLGLSWIAVLVVVHPLIVPDAPGRTLVAALAAASMDPLGLLVTAARGAPLPPVSQLFWASLPTYVCALLAVIPARLVTHLGRQVSAARELGSYRLGERLGGGGMGEVYRAEHRLLARPAAIKLIRPALLGDADPEARRRIIARFEREAQVMAQLRSPHTVALYDYGYTDDGTLFTVMELLEGFDLDSFVARFGPVNPARTVHLLQQVCDSLAEAHEKGLVHRDIKPSNIVVGQRGRCADFVTVLDFGLVKALRLERQDSALATATTQLTGTPAFMSPEQALGDPVDARSDLYAVGCVAYFLLTGHVPFKGHSVMDVIAKHVREPPRPPSACSELEIPAQLDAAVLACLEKDPARRPASADAVARLLGDAIQEVWTAARAAEWWRTHHPHPTAAATDGAPSHT